MFRAWRLRATATFGRLSRRHRTVALATTGALALGAAVWALNPPEDRRRPHRGAPAVQEGTGPGPTHTPDSATGFGLAPTTRAPRPSPTAPPAANHCQVGLKLVPSCGVLWGVAPGAHTPERGPAALAAFERRTGRVQDLYHGYHRGQHEMFPTPAELAIARGPRVLFLNWKPTGASWARIARGHRPTDDYLDRLSRHLRAHHRAQMFFTVHHEPEDDVRPRRGSGYTARDYAAMYRHVINRLRARGVDNLVTVLVHMAYPRLTSMHWFGDLYPGDDVVDWIGFDAYAYSTPGYGYGDFAELVNRRSTRTGWPGFYTWASIRHPEKPLMVAEWGVWHSKANASHQAALFRSVAAQISRFPKIKALVYFDTPSDQRGRDSRVERTTIGLDAFRDLGNHPAFTVRLTS
ncbi:glycosyl hydrolase [Pilimelia columellifera]